MNNKKAPFDQKEVRQALFYAIDAQQILDMVGGGAGNIIRTNMFSSFSKYYNTQLDMTYSYNIEKAKELLKQAGYPDGFSFTIQVPSNYIFIV